ncbi:MULTISPECIES: HNH endonuclease [unclassified Nocardia]|uniref:HNH endonuclease n=1 Tax=unclassified Nocardia TaxID=2637762 RepID=UPI001CE3E0B8|nr:MULTISPECIES: HNH endonuclease [unclassified Nocardia]
MEIGEELDLRLRIFDRLAQELAAKGSLTRDELTEFPVDGTSYRLIDRNRGIWNPRGFAATLSILSKPDSQYQDDAVGESLFGYAYRAGSMRGDNTKLRRAVELKLPVILLRWIADGIYVPIAPVYVVADDMPNQRVILAMDETLREVADPLHLQPLERAYATRITRQRLHQPEFRARILQAYQHRCGVCNLGHPQLLDAAHIIADTAFHGLASTENGLCLCKLHHAAYDTNLLGISPTFEIRIAPKLMRDRTTGPTLQHALQGVNGTMLVLPKRRVDHPAPKRLAERFMEFEKANGVGQVDISWPTSTAVVPAIGATSPNTHNEAGGRVTEYSQPARVSTTGGR